MEISKYNSKKIAILNVMAIMMVLLIHSYYLEAESYTIAQKVQVFTGTNGLSSVAVPLFYFISGLLFFKSVQSIRDCFFGIKKRVKTLVLPYVIWNVIFVGWYVVMSLIPGISQFINSDVLSYFNWEHPLEGLHYLLVKPAGFHLWFLRDLIVFVIVSPLLYPLLKQRPWITFIALFVFCGGILSCGITYFCLGGIIALHVGLDNLNRSLTKPVIAFCGLAFIANAVMAVIPGCMAIVHNPFFQQIVNVSGILLVWSIYDFLLAGKELLTLNSFGRLSRYTFFVYLFHEPAFNLIKKLNLRLLGISNGSLTFLYFFNPIVMLFVSVGIAIIIKKYLPKIYLIIVGGR